MIVYLLLLKLTEEDDGWNNTLKETSSSYL
jgi:hypothetical protein